MKLFNLLSHPVLCHTKLISYPWLRLENSKLIQTECNVLSCRCPYLTEKYSVAIPVCEGALALFVLANFAHATFRDPGIVPRGKLTDNLVDNPR